MPVFSEQFEFQLPTLVNFVGGGGKTSLILRLVDEMGQAQPVLYTTTTRIHPPHPAGGISVLSCDDLPLLKAMLGRSARFCPPGYSRLVATRLPVGPGLLGGVPPDFARDLRAYFPLILNEADGARSMSLKFPRPGEPVLMEGGDCLVAVIGADCLGRLLGPEAIFRWEILSARLPLREGELLTPQLAASILLHPEGVCRDWRPGMRLLVYVNKVHSDREEGPARELAYALLNSGAFPVERVVLGSVEQLRAFSIAPGRQ